MPTHDHPDQDTIAQHGVNPELRLLKKASTGQLRSVWGPACQAKGEALLPAYMALDACLEAHGYAPRQIDTGAFNCRPITGGSGYSLHAYGPGQRFTFWSGAKVNTAVAVDINWQTNPYGPRLVTDMPKAMIAAVKKVRTFNGKQVWRWGGDYTGNKDAMHFEVVCSPGDLATGIDPKTLPSATPEPSQEDDWMSDPAGTARMLFRLYLGRNPNNQAELDLHTVALVQRGLNARCAELADSPEGKAWEAKQRRAG